MWIINDIRVTDVIRVQSYDKFRSAPHDECVWYVDSHNSNSNYELATDIALIPRCLPAHADEVIRGRDR